MEIEADLARVVRRFGDTVREVAPDQWHAATPCAAWDVRALVNHLVSEAAWVKPLMDGLTIAEVGDRLDGDLLGDDPIGAYDRAAAEAIASIAESDAMQRVVHISSGDAPAPAYLAQLFIDFVVHRWDLARAIGADDTIEPSDAGAIYAQMAPMEDEMRSWGVYGDRVEVADDADLQTKLLALFGRVR
jgi:uncharacterized protein (TIGR03086 family)